jgi:hypothetical protein
MLQYAAPLMKPVHTRHVTSHHSTNVYLKPAQYFDVSEALNYPSSEQCVYHPCGDTVAVNSTEHCEQRNATEVSQQVQYITTHMGTDYTQVDEINASLQEIKRSLAAFSSIHPQPAGSFQLETETTPSLDVRDETIEDLFLQNRVLNVDDFDVSEALKHFDRRWSEAQLDSCISTLGRSIQPREECKDARGDGCTRSDSCQSASGRESFHAIEPFVSDTVLAEAFSSDNLRPDLPRCPSYPEPEPEYPDDRLHFLFQELARTVRLDRLCCRWLFSENLDWFQEVFLLSKAVSIPTNMLQPWTPVLNCLTLFQDAFETKDKSGRSGQTQVLFRVKRQVEVYLKQIVIAKLASIEYEHSLLPTKNFGWQSTFGVVMTTVKDDCEKRGSLLLRTVPEFTERFKSRQSPGWSWTD